MSDIRHAHLYGMREAKYDWLSTHDVNSTDWKEVEPQKPFHLLIPQNDTLFIEYDEGWKITDIMNTNGWGIATRKDYLLVDFLKDKLVEKFINIKDLTTEEAISKYEIKQSPHWNFSIAKNLMSRDTINHVKSVLFRPFDIRFLYYEKCMIERGDHRYGLMSNMFHENISLITVRRSEESNNCHHFYCSDTISILHSTSAKEGNFVFPLYIYPDLETSQQSTFIEKRRPNFSDEFLTEITSKLSYTPTPEAIFYYIYAIFHSPTYRTRYAEFLKIDFPRVPLTSSDQLFRKLGEYGEELVALHLMKSSKLEQHLTQIIDKGGEFIVDAGHPKYTDGEVIINKKGDRFTGVPKSVWEFYVGGYQVCHKWLKDRKGRQLSPEDLNHYQKIIVALSETMQIMNAIDAAIPSFPIE
jgi:predicted helicase